MEPGSTPVLIFFHVETCLLRTTRCFPSFKKSSRSLVKAGQKPNNKTCQRQEQPPKAVLEKKNAH